MSTKKTADKKEPGFEAQLKELQLIAERLEKGELSLEESLTAYAEGMALAQICRKKLDEARHTVRIHTEEGLQDFESSPTVEILND